MSTCIDKRYSYQEVLENFLDLQTTWRLNEHVEIPYSLRFRKFHSESLAKDFGHKAVIAKHSCKLCYRLNSEKTVGQPEIFCITSPGYTRCAMCICLHSRYTHCEFSISPTHQTMPKGENSFTTRHRQRKHHDQRQNEQVLTNQKQVSSTIQSCLAVLAAPRNSVKRGPSDDENSSPFEYETKRAKSSSTAKGEVVSHDTLFDQRIYRENHVPSTSETEDKEEETTEMKEESFTSQQESQASIDEESIEEGALTRSESSQVQGDHKVANEPILSFHKDDDQKSDNEKDEDNIGIVKENDVNANVNKDIPCEQTKLEGFMQIFNDFTAEVSMKFEEKIREIIVESDRAKDLEKQCEDQRNDLDVKDEKIEDLQQDLSYSKQQVDELQEQMIEKDAFIKQLQHENTSFKAQIDDLEKKKELAIKNEQKLVDELFSEKAKNLKLEKQVRDREIASR